MTSLKAVDSVGLVGDFDFDHVRGEKTFGVARIANYSKDRIMLELEKCELVCACCHRLRTERRKTGNGTDRPSD